VSPDYQAVMRPVLDAASHGEISVANAIAKISNDLDLKESERAELLPSGRQTVIANRVHWAKTYLKQAGLVEITKRGHFRITSEGRIALSSVEEIDRKFLLKYNSFVQFTERSRTAETADGDGTSVELNETTPDEAIRKAFDEINEALTAELLDRVRDAPPAFFESLIVELLVAMGYGGTAEEPGKILGQTGDDGVDGVIDQDPLGVDQIYLQAKRCQAGNSIGPGAVRDFYGSLSLKRAHKGIFVTTSTFTASAIQTARNLGSSIVLIDGLHLARLMIRYSVGCRDERILHLKKVDEEYFEFGTQEFSS
jgi:restriction system protein